MRKLRTIRTTAPAESLISTERARLQVRRDDTDDDVKIERAIKSALSYLDGVDGILNKALLNQTWTESADGFPSGDCYIFDLMPLVSVSSVKYYDLDNVQQTFDSSNYLSHNGRTDAYIKLVPSASWPSTYERDDAISIEAVFGHGTSPDDVDQSILEAADLLIGHFVNNREASLVGTIASELPFGIMELLRPHMRPHF